MDKLGNIGVRRNLVIRIGATFGPYPVSFSNPDGSPVDVTGCTLHARAKRKFSDTAVLFTFECPIVNPTVKPQALFGLPAEATEEVECADDPRHPSRTAVWEMNLHDSTGVRVIPLRRGTISLYPKV